MNYKVIGLFEDKFFILRIFDPLCNYQHLLWIGDTRTLRHYGFLSPLERVIVTKGIGGYPWHDNRDLSFSDSEINLIREEIATCKNIFYRSDQSEVKKE